MYLCGKAPIQSVMKQSEERYISLLTDFGFKRIFGTDLNKDLLINFLNSLFNGEEVIKDVKYLNSENVGDVFTERKAIFDVYCENEQGEKFIVEMQNAYQTFFKDRSLFYSTFPIREQAPKGSDWNFCLKKVYVVALLNFKMSDEAFDASDTIHTIALMDTKTNKVFNAKLMFKYVEVGRFDKTDEELTSLSDKWMFVLKNLSRLNNRPSSLREKIFSRLFDAAAIARFTPIELREYEDSLKAYRDIKNSLDTAEAKGREEGINIANLAIAKRMLSDGMDMELVLKYGVNRKTNKEIEPDNFFLSDILFKKQHVKNMQHVKTE
jgi:predicted transposase/invertase (TIGR01784 family)